MAMSGKSAFTEISNAKISKKRTAIISRLTDGSYTIGQQMEVHDDEHDKPMKIFLKGAIHAADLEGLQSLRDAITIAIDLEEKRLHCGKKSKK